MLTPEREKEIREESNEDFACAYGHTDMLKELLAEIVKLKNDRSEIDELIKNLEAEIDRLRNEELNLLDERNQNKAGWAGCKKERDQLHEKLSDAAEAICRLLDREDSDDFWEDEQFALQVLSKIRGEKC